MLLHPLLVAAILLCLPLKLLAQVPFSTMGARANGLANAGACLRDEWSQFNNIGGLAKVESTTAAFTYQLPSSLPGAHRMAALVAVPTAVGTAGMGIFRFGDELYNEQILSAGFSNQFGLASLGARINYIQYNAEGFGRKGVVSISVGGIAEIVPGFLIGAYLTNLNQPEISRNEEHLPTTMALGLAYAATENIFITCEVEKDIAYKPVSKCGIEYKPFGKISFRTGFNIQPGAIFFGTGFYTRGLRIDYSLQHATPLGFIQQASVAYHIQSK